MTPEFFVAIAAGCLVLLVFFAVGLFRRDRASERVGALSQFGTRGSFQQSAYAGVMTGASRGSESAVSRRLRQEEKKNQFKEKMVQAGLYSKSASQLFAVVRVISLIVPISIGVVAGRLGWTSVGNGILFGVVIGLAGVLAPTFWLDYLKSTRQTKVRRALPDALDVISVCLEGGLSLPAAITRVAHELATAHPMLALELAIVERQIQMGQTTGVALREMAMRFDLEELRSLANVVVHAERYGTSVTKALETYADTLRTKRHQRAEEMGQKAIIKMLFPTLFLIFPGIFIVVLGPAFIQMYEILLPIMLDSESPF